MIRLWHQNVFFFFFLTLDDPHMRFRMMDSSDIAINHHMNRFLVVALLHLHVPTFIPHIYNEHASQQQQLKE